MIFPRKYRKSVGIKGKTRSARALSSLTYTVSHAKPCARCHRAGAANVLSEILSNPMRSTFHRKYRCAALAVTTLPGNTAKTIAFKDRNDLGGAGE